MPSHLATVPLVPTSVACQGAYQSKFDLIRVPFGGAAAVIASSLLKVDFFGLKFACDAFIDPAAETLPHAGAITNSPAAVHIC